MARCFCPLAPRTAHTQVSRGRHQGPALRTQAGARALLPTPDAELQPRVGPLALVVPLLEMYLCIDHVKACVDSMGMLFRHKALCRAWTGHRIWPMALLACRIALTCARARFPWKLCRTGASLCELRAFRYMRPERLGACQPPICHAELCRGPAKRLRKRARRGRGVWLESAGAPRIWPPAPKFGRSRPNVIGAGLNLADWVDLQQMWSTPLQNPAEPAKVGRSQPTFGRNRSSSG